MPDAPDHPRLAVTIPKTSIEAAQAEFRAWGAVASARVIGENDHEIAFYLAIIASPVALALGAARQVMEARVRKLGGRIGAAEEWLIGDEDLGDLMTWRT